MIRSETEYKCDYSYTHDGKQVNGRWPNGSIRVEPLPQQDPRYYGFANASDLLRHGSHRHNEWYRRPRKVIPENWIGVDWDQRLVLLELQKFPYWTVDDGGGD